MIANEYSSFFTIAPKLSDAELANEIQKKDPVKSPIALGTIDARNNERAKEKMLMNKPPTIAEREIAEAMPQVAGIGANGIPVDPNMSLAVINGVGALPSQFPRDNTGILRAETPMTMMAAGGGLVALAEGGQVIPFQNTGRVPSEAEIARRMLEESLEYGYTPNIRRMENLTEDDLLKFKIAQERQNLLNLQKQRDPEGILALGALDDRTDTSNIYGMGEKPLIDATGQGALTAGKGIASVTTGPLLDQIAVAEASGNPNAKRIIEGIEKLKGIPGQFIEQTQTAAQAGNPIAQQGILPTIRQNIQNIGSKLKSDFQKTDFGSRFGKLGEGVRPYTGAREDANKGELGLGALMPEDGIVGVADRIGKNLKTAKTALQEFGGDLKRSRDDLGLYLTEDVPEYYKRQFKASQEKSKTSQEKSKTKKDNDKPKPAGDLLDPNATEKLSKADANALALTGKKDQQAKAIKDSVVGEFAKGKDKKDTSNFNNFIIRLGLGAMAAPGATGLLDAVGKAAPAAFEAYERANREDKKQILEQTKLNIQRERNQILGDYQRAAIAAKSGLTGGDQIKLLEYVNTQPQVVQGKANQLFDIYLQERKNKTKAENSRLPLELRNTVFKKTGLFSFFGELDEFDELDDAQKSLFKEAAKTQFFKELSGNIRGGATQSNVPSSSPAPAPDPDRVNALLESLNRQ